MKTKTLIVDLEAYNTVVPPVRIPSAQPTRHCEPPAVAPHTTKFAGATNLFQCDEKLDFESDGTGSSNPLRSTDEALRTAGPVQAIPRGSVNMTFGKSSLTKHAWGTESAFDCRRCRRARSGLTRLRQAELKPIRELFLR
jgi:hypothetical protein